jgi:putative chitinase
MSITEQQLQRIMPNARRQAGVFVSALNTAMARRQIDTPMPYSSAKLWPASEVQA